MFWRSIPRATEVLGSQRTPSPVSEPDPPPFRPPRPARPFPPPGAPASSSTARGATSPGRTRPLLSLKKSNARLRRAAQEIIDMNRSAHQHRPEHFSDVVEQVMARPEKVSRPKSGLKRAKSVVSLFHRHSKPREASSGGAGDVDHASPGAQSKSTSSSLRSRRSSSLSASSVLSDSSGFDASLRGDRFAPELEAPYAPDSQHISPSRDRYPEEQLEAMRLSTSGPGESLPADRPPRSWHREAPYEYEVPPPAPFGRSATRGPASVSHSEQRATLSRNSVTGLVNLGNSCYLASIVQVLLATPPLEKFFLEDDYLREINTANRLGSGGELAETFAELCKVAASGEFRSLSPAYLQEALARWAPQYSDESQQDAHECLLSLLDGLHEDLNLVLRPPPPIETSPARELALQQLPEVVAADLVWKEYRDRQDSVIVDFFHGQVRNRMECLRCHTTSSTFHALQTLSLALPRVVNNHHAHRRAPTDLQDCIADYLQEEILRGENAWRCPTCKSPQVASKRVSIARLPQFLVIHLERFAYNARKITSPISFPLSGLELGGLLPPMALAYPSPYSLNVPHESGTSYELYAAVCHHGEDGSGHYTTLVRRRRRRRPRDCERHDGGFDSGGEGEERWIEIDDEIVTPLATPDELDDALLRAEETAYLLFYRISDLSSETGL